MIENESKTRSPKSQGVINGRSKKSTIRKRRKICRMLAADESNNLKTKKDFLKKYRQKLVEKKIDPIPSDQTLKKDMDDCKIDFKYGIARISTDDTIFDSLGYDINYSLRQMRLIYGSNDITLLNTYTKPMLYPKTLKGFLSPLDELIANTSTEENISSSNTNTATKSKKIAKNFLMYLHFILDKKGFEDLIEDAFCKDCSTPPYFLYIDKHSYCVTIVFEYENLETIMKKTYDIIKNCPY